MPKTIRKTELPQPKLQKSIVVRSVVLFAAACLFHDFAALHGGLQVVHTIADFAEDARLLEFLLVPAQCAVDAFVVLNLNQKHYITYFL
jgi:hypothetical protein